MSAVDATSVSLFANMQRVRIRAPGTRYDGWCGYVDFDELARARGTDRHLGVILSPAAANASTIAYADELEVVDETTEAQP